MKVAVSAGHYPKRPGAVFEGTNEHEKAVSWAKSITFYLRNLGVEVFEVPTGGLGKKIRNINSEKCDLAIEIHFNSDPGRRGKGSETLYYPWSKKGEELADKVQRSISAFCSPNRGAKPGWYRMDQPGHIDYKGDVEGDEIPDAFLAKTNCTALIIEPYFLHEVDRISDNIDVVCDTMAFALWEWLDEKR